LALPCNISLTAAQFRKTLTNKTNKHIHRLEPITLDQLFQFVKEHQALCRKVDRILTLLEQGANGSNPAATEQPIFIKEASDFIGLKVGTVYTKVSRREIPFSKKGKLLIFFKSELSAWMKQGRQKTMDEILTEADAVGMKKLKH
jgi:excisionase family DNA binding protein